MIRLLGKSIAVLLLKFPFFRDAIFKLYSPAIRVEYKNLTNTSFINLLDLLKVDHSPFGLIRMGSNFDGGYVVAKSFGHDDFLLSFGVGTDVSFEESLSHSIKGIHLYDHTVDRLPSEIINATFFQRGLAVAPSRNMTDLEGAFLNVPSHSEIILKIDIEGDEWGILAGASTGLLGSFKQIVIEFHNLESINSLSNYELIFGVLQKLRVTHNVVNVHGNNWDTFRIIHGQFWPNALEVTYLNKRFFPEPNTDDYSRLNLPNNPERADYNLGLNYFKN